LLCNQHRRLVIGGLCWFAVPRNFPIFNFDTHPKWGILPLSGECRGDNFWGTGMGLRRELEGENWRGAIPAEGSGKSESLFESSDLLCNVDHVSGAESN